MVFTSTPFFLINIRNPRRKNSDKHSKPLTRPGATIIECDVSVTTDVLIEGLISGCLYELVIYGQICPKDRKLTIEDDLKRIADQMFYTKLEDVTLIEIDEEDDKGNFL